MFDDTPPSFDSPHVVNYLSAIGGAIRQFRKDQDKPVSSQNGFGTLFKQYFGNDMHRSQVKALEEGSPSMQVKNYIAALDLMGLLPSVLHAITGHTDNLRARNLILTDGALLERVHRDIKKGQQVLSGRADKL